MFWHVRSSLISPDSFVMPVRLFIPPHVSAPTGLIFVKFGTGDFLKDLSGKSGFG